MAPTWSVEHFLHLDRIDWILPHQIGLSLLVGLSCPKMKPNQMFQNRKNSQFFPKIIFKYIFAKKGITVVIYIALKWVRTWSQRVIKINTCPAAAKSISVGWNLISLIGWLDSVFVAMQFPFRKSQIFNELSSLPETKNFPSGLRSRFSSISLY